MSNVLDDHIQQQVVALGRLGWSLRRIEAATGTRRETASGYLKAAGVPVRGPGRRPAIWPPKPATTDAVSTALVGHQYDIAPDGRFIVNVVTDDPSKLILISGWTSRLKP